MGVPIAGYEGFYTVDEFGNLIERIDDLLAFQF